jgi:hypothetical protein
MSVLKHLQVGPGPIDLDQVWQVLEETRKANSAEHWQVILTKARQMRRSVDELAQGEDWQQIVSGMVKGMAILSPEMFGACRAYGTSDAANRETMNIYSLVSTALSAAVIAERWAHIPDVPLDTLTEPLTGPEHLDEPDQHGDGPGHKVHVHDGPCSDSECPLEGTREVLRLTVTQGPTDPHPFTDLWSHVCCPRHTAAILLDTALLLAREHGIPSDELSAATHEIARHRTESLLDGPSPTSPDGPAASTGMYL